MRQRANGESVQPAPAARDGSDIEQICDVATSFMIPAPTWLIALDMLAAYLLMAWLGIQIGTRMKQGKTAARKRQA